MLLIHTCDRYIAMLMQYIIIANIWATNNNPPITIPSDEFEDPKLMKYDKC